MEIQANSITQSYQTNTVSKARVDELYSDFMGEDDQLHVSFHEEELKKLTYEEAKALREKLETNGHFKDIDESGNERSSFGSGLLQVTGLTNDDSFNKAMFETMKTKESPGFYLMELRHNMEYTQGKRAHPWPTISVEEAQGKMHRLTPQELKEIDVQEFLNDIIKTYEELLLNLPYYLDREETENTLNGYKELQENYQKEQNEKNAILESYTKNTKENPLLNKK